MPALHAISVPQNSVTLFRFGTPTAACVTAWNMTFEDNPTEKASRPLLRFFIFTRSIIQRIDNTNNSPDT